MRPARSRIIMTSGDRSLVGWSRVSLSGKANGTGVLKRKRELEGKRLGIGQELIAVVASRVVGAFEILAIPTVRSAVEQARRAAAILACQA